MTLKVVCGIITEMKFLKFLAGKKAFLLLILAFSLVGASLVSARPIWAQPTCDLFECVGQEIGYCQEGTVIECTTGRKKCVGGNWEDTGEDLRDLCTTTGLRRGSSLEKFQEALAEPGYNLEKFVGGEELIGTGPTGIVPAVANAVSCMVGGCGVTEQGSARTGAIGTITALNLGMITNPPASSKEYLAYLGQNLGVVKPVYAQGLGFMGLSPILPLWRFFRNVAYLAFVVVFVIVGIMVMLRKKIDPRTVATIQEALPRIVIALLLVTFSYAIAGFIVDLGTISTRVIGNAFRQEKFIACAPTDREPYCTNEPESIKRLEALLRADIFSLVNPLRDVRRLTQQLARIELGVTVLGTGVTIDLIFRIAALFIMFKIFFSLLGPYVSIILSVIFAPFQLLVEALPGASSFGSWLRNLAANVAVFPVVFGLLALSATFKSNEFLEGPQGSRFTGPGADWYTNPHNRYLFDALWSPSGLGTWGPIMGQLISFGILFTIPKAAEMIKTAIGVRPGPPAPAAEEIKAAARRLPIVGSFIS